MQWECMEKRVLPTLNVKVGAGKDEASSGVRRGGSTRTQTGSVDRWGCGSESRGSVGLRTGEALKLGRGYKAPETDVWVRG